MSDSQHADRGPLQRLTEAAFRRPLVVVVLTVLAIFWGVLTAPFDLVEGGLPRDPVPVDALPDTGDNQQIVFADWPGRSPQDVEDQITYPLTAELLGVPGVATVRSTSMFGFATSFVIFEDDVEFYAARSRIVEQLASLPEDALPAGVTPRLGPDATSLGQVFWYTLEGQDAEGRPVGGWDPQELRSIQDFQIRYALRGVPGVAEVASIGGFVREYQVDVDPDALRVHGVSLQDVFRAVRDSNRDVGARTIELNRVEYLVRGLGRIESIADLESAVVRVVDGVPLTLREVARVGFGPALRRGVLDRGGAEAVGGTVVVRHGANPMAVLADVRARIAEIAPGLPSRTLDDGRTSRVTVVPFYDRSELIAETLDTLRIALGHELLITLAVILLMVGHLRSALLVSGLLPLGVLLTFVAMRYLHVDANLVSLAGIAIAIGTMVDTGIVMADSVLQHLRGDDTRLTRLTAIRRGVAEVGGAVSTAVATTVVGFLPVFAMQGAEGRLFAPLAWTKTLALIAAIATSLLVLPAAAAWLLHRADSRRNTLVAVIGYAVAAGLAAWVIAWWVAVVVLGVAVARATDGLMPARVGAWLGRFGAVALALLAVQLLAAEWQPIGVGRDRDNLLFTAALVFGVVGLCWLLRLLYVPLLRVFLCVPSTFLVLPSTAVIAGLLAWRGHAVVADWLPRAGLTIGVLALASPVTGLLVDATRGRSRARFGGGALVAGVAALGWTLLGGPLGGALAAVGTLAAGSWMLVARPGLAGVAAAGQAAAGAVILAGVSGAILWLGLGLGDASESAATEWVVAGATVVALAIASLAALLPSRWAVRCGRRSQLLAALLLAAGGAALIRGVHDGLRSADPASLGARLAAAFPGLGEEFLPPFDEGSFLLMPVTMAHASIGEARDVLQKQDRAIRAIPEVRDVVGKIGRVDSPLDPAPIGMIETVVTYVAEWRRDSDGRLARFRWDSEHDDFARDADGELVADPDGRPLRQWRDEIRSTDDLWDAIEQAARLPGTTTATKLGPIETRRVMLQTGMRAPIGVKISGPELAILEDVGLRMQELLQGLPEVDGRTVFAERIVGKPYLEIDLDREALARYGLSVGAVQEVLEVAVGGRPLTRTVEGRERYPVRVRYLRELRDQQDELARILVPAPVGGSVPLGQVASIRYARGPQSIRSEDGFPTAYVTFDGADGEALVDVVEACRDRLELALERGELVLPDGVSYRFAGNYENQVRASERLSVLLPVALAVIFLLLYLQFSSLWATLVAFSGVFVAWAGGFLLLWAYGQDGFLAVEVFGRDLSELFHVGPVQLSVAVWVGFLALFGIATDDGVLMGTYLQGSFRERRPTTRRAVRDAVVAAASRRIRPALTTSATTVLALLPVLASDGRGAEIMQPMAIPGFGGMVLVGLTVFVVPVLWSVAEELRLRFRPHRS